MARASISDVAQLAGVSESTVSRALNGKGRVSDHTRQRVTAAADELNFTLSRNASTLATGKTMRVLFLVSGELKAWFNASALQGVYGVLAPEGYDVMPSFIMNGAELQRYFAELPKNRNADAIIVSSFMFSQELHDQLAASGMPVIGLNSPSTQGFDASITIDDNIAVAQGVQLLHSLGHRKIAFLHDCIPTDMLYSTSTRTESFIAAAHRLGYTDDDCRIFSAEPHQNGHPPSDTFPKLTAQLLSCGTPITGIMAETDEFAIPLIKELRKQQVLVPEDVSVLGFDDANIADIADLTTIHQDPIELGRRAAIKALALMRGKTLEHPHEVLPTRPVLRQTTRRVHMV
ncbi:LacI family transcriptional regulator [Bifidobacteriaceae bacterium MCC02031]|nr:LacI family transcriptional regulator [Bifidobacteriaceae bacterium MCC02031]